jgi:hypothetical protein
VHVTRARLALVVALAMGCGKASDGATATDDGGGASAVDAGDDGASTGDGGDASDGGLKARCRGLMNPTSPPPQGTPCAFMDSTVVGVDWAALEPNPPADGGSGFDDAAFRPIDDALARFHVRLRVHAGIAAPSWVKRLEGPARSFPGSTTCDASGGVEVYDTAASKGGCVPYFWKASVKAAYDALMAEIARRYEGNENFGEVVDGMCMTVFDEVLYRSHCEARSVANLAAAGFDFAGAEGDLQCQKDALSIHAKRFARTRVSLATNAWDVISNGACSTSFAPTADLARWAEPLLGQRLVLQHNHLSPSDGCAPDGGGAEDSCFIAEYPGPRGFQTQAYAKISTPQLLYATLDDALSLHANFVEIPQSCPGADDVATLAAYDAKLRREAP